ncbi:hypothetical protein, partial [Segatella oulorum]|uniref:hypothetical protein n=1 Tax=Segatella oulorum TaxID=28136 RepID=UPI0023F30CCE
ERLHGMQEVRGSIPLVSTKKLSPASLICKGLRGFCILVVLCNIYYFSRFWAQRGRNHRSPLHDNIENFAFFT